MGARFMRISATFSIVTIAWVFFRSESITQAFNYLDLMFTASLFSLPSGHKTALVLLGVYLLTEWFQRDREHLLDVSYIPSRVLRYSIYYAVVFMVFYYAGNLQTFIYFQF